MDQVFSKIPFDDNKIGRIFATPTASKTIDLVILHNSEAWRATITENTLEEFATKHEKNSDQFMRSFLNVLKNDDNDYIFSLNLNQFRIKQKIANSHIKVHFFEHRMEKLNYQECMEQIIDNFHSMHCETLTHLKENTHANIRSEQLKTEYEKKLDELVKRKIADQDQLFAHFVCVLNEKKKRIQHLTQMLEAYNAKETKTTIENVSVSKHEAISESESDATASELNTDDEEAPKQTKTDCKPSTSSNVADDILDDNIPTRPKIAKLASKKRQDDDSPEMSMSRDEIMDFTPSLQAKPKQEKQSRAKSTFDLNTQDLLDSY